MSGPPSVRRALVNAVSLAGLLASPVPASEPWQLPMPPQHAMTATVSSLRFDLGGCELEGTVLTCSAEVTNLGSRRELRFPCLSSAWDELGNEYQPSGIKLAKTSWTCSRADSFGLAKTVANGVTSRLVLTYKTVRPDLRTIPRLQISFHAGEGESGSVNFRDIVPRRR